MAMILANGISFSGGFIFTPPPPPPQNTAGWFGGGNEASNPTSTVNRITYATDTATASVRGPLSLARFGSAAVGNFTYGWFGAGRSYSTSTYYSTVDRITYATDTATASVRGPLSSARYSSAATGNTTDGWFGGGQIGPPSYDPVSTVDRITYATDNNTASVRGPLSSATGRKGAAGNTTDGWFGGGYIGVPLSTVNRITYATDTATASVRGPLSSGRQRLSAAGNTTDGWFGGGRINAPGPLSTVDRITYATDTATASVRGPLSAGRYGLGAASNTTDAWFGGGAQTAFSTVDRITYATDTATASVRGPLSGARYNLAAAGGIQ
jgi:hypothetical protein